MRSSCRLSKVLPPSGLLLLVCVRGHLLADALFILSHLDSVLGTKVVILEHLANLDLRFPREEWIRSALDPLDRLVQRFYLEQPEASDQLLRLGERPIDHGPFASRESHANSL